MTISMNFYKYLRSKKELTQWTHKLRQATDFLVSSFFYLTLSTGVAFAQRVPFKINNENFSSESLTKGVQASAEQCSLVENSVWAKTKNNGGECIRYWIAGKAGISNQSGVLVYIPSDQMSFDTAYPDYSKRSPSSMQIIVDEIYSRVNVPTILLSRPGIFGSSGEHKGRRLLAESLLMSAALDEIKLRYEIETFSLVGLSGGGHVVVSLLGLRSDIVCAVPTSSVSSPRLRWELMGRKSDFTGNVDSYEPVDSIKASNSFHPKLRVFVLGDPMDTNVPWQTQTPLVDRLKDAGVETEKLTGIGSDSQRHALGSSGQLIGSLCLQGKSTKDISIVAANGLKG